MDYKIFKLGIDLSTKKTGWALLNENNELLNYGIVENLGWNSDAWYVAFGNFLKFSYKIKAILENKKFKLIVGVELSNHGDLNSQRFHFFAGMIYSIFLTSFLEKSFNQLEFKFVNPNQWFKELFNDLTKNREQRKKTTLEFLKKHTNLDLSEDEADAFAIAFNIENLKNSYEINEIVREFKKQKSNTKKLKIILNEKIIKLKNKLLDLKITKPDTKANKNKIKKLEDQINLINEKIHELEK